MVDFNKKICSCGSTLNYDLFTDNYICPVCNRKYILEVGGNLKLIVDTGNKQSESTIGRGESAQTRDFIECPICGKQNLRENTFRCSECGKTGICLIHQDNSSHLCNNCRREKQQEYLSDIEKTRSYLQELENITKKDRGKFFKIVKQYAGKVYLREIQIEIFKRNIFLLVLSFGCLFVSIFSMINEEFTICGTSLVIYVLVSIVAIFRNYSTLSDAIEDEIAQAKEQIAAKYHRLQNISPTADSNWTSPVQYGKVNPAWLQPGWSSVEPVPVNAMESPKQKSGGCTTAFWYLLLVVGVVFLFWLWARQLVPDWTDVSNEPDNASSIFGDQCKVWRERYVIELCTVQEGGGNTLSGYKWCRVKERSNGALLHRWVPDKCTK